MKARLLARARELGFDACAVSTASPPDHSERFRAWLAAGHQAGMSYLDRTADRRCQPGLVLPGARSVICVAASYHQPEPHAGPDTGRVARYARFADYHDLLGHRLRELAAFVEEVGGASTRTACHVDAGPVLERDLAQRAGLGFIGKHTNLIRRNLGNWLFLAEILTTAALEPDAPEPNRCGTCTRCLDACPTGAFPEPFVLDARRCISYLTIENKGPIPVELRPALGTRIFGCDDCLEVCPWNRFARAGRLLAAHTRPDLAAPGLVPLLALDDAGFKSRFAGTPLLRAKRRGLLRNVCVALGNLENPAALPALERAAADPEPLVAEHARWAIGRIRSRATTGAAPAP